MNNPTSHLQLGAPASGLDLEQGQTQNLSLQTAPKKLSFSPRVRKVSTKVVLVCTMVSATVSALIGPENPKQPRSPGYLGVEPATLQRAYLVIICVWVVSMYIYYRIGYWSTQSSFDMSCHITICSASILAGSIAAFRLDVPFEYAMKFGPLVIILITQVAHHCVSTIKECQGLFAHLLRYERPRGSN